MAAMPAESVDAIVCDPPYLLGFMGKEWDVAGRQGVDDLRDRHPDATGKSVSPFYRPGWGNSDARNSTLASQEWHHRWAAEALRVAKPGAYLLAFGGTRTSHRLACAIEDAGWIIRDTLVWAYASGFPKSHDVSKAIDRMRHDDLQPVREFLWAARVAASRSVAEVADHFAVDSRMVHKWMGERVDPQAHCPTWDQWLVLKALLGFGDEMDAEVWRLNGRKGKPGEAWDQREVIRERTMVQGGGSSLELRMGERREVEANITAPATPDAEKWQGWGTALKPAWEPIVMARKPFAGSVAENLLRHGTGALNIDGTRIAAEPYSYPNGAGGTNFGGTHERPTDRIDGPAGRWPANVILTDDIFSGGVEGVVGGGDVKAGVAVNRNKTPGAWSGNTIYGERPVVTEDATYGDTGTYSRFFLIPKSARNEREPAIRPEGGDARSGARLNAHPT
jgi:hypothetical protein